MGRIVLSGIEFKFEKVNDELGETGVLKENLFLGNLTLTEAEIDTITVIEDRVFKNCSNLIKTSFPNMMSIGEEAFYYCDNLKELDVSKVGVIGKSSFYGCGLSEINMNNTITEIPEKAFARSKVKTIIFPTGLKKIGDLAFSYCTSLVIPSLPDSVEEIGELAFEYINFYNGVSITKFPKNLKKIGAGAFSGLVSLGEMELPNKLEYIGKYAFSSLINFKITKIPDSVTYIGEQAFSYTKVAITQYPKHLSTVPAYAFGDCLNMVDLTLGAKGYPMSVIGEGAFYNCTNLTKITIYTANGAALAGAPWGATNATITYLPA